MSDSQKYKELLSEKLSLLDEIHILTRGPLTSNRMYVCCKRVEEIEKELAKMDEQKERESMKNNVSF